MRCSPFRGPKDITSLGDPLVAFASSSKTTRIDAAPFRAPPLRFLPLRRITSTRQPLTSQNFQALGYVALTAFQRSQGLPPPGTSRPCFMPGPPLGFPLGDLPHPKITAALQSPCPPAVHSLVGSAPLTCRTVPLGVTYRAPVNLYRAAVPVSSAPGPCPLRMPVIVASWFRLGNDPRPSLGLFLIRVCSPFAGDAPSNQSLTCFVPGAHAKPGTAPQSLASEWHGRALSSSPPLPRFITF